MQLQKLPYIAHGWGLTILGDNLVANRPQAWKYGPVYPELYESLRRYGAGNVTDLIHEDDDDPFSEDRGPVVTAELSDNERRLIDAVWDSYRNYNGVALSMMTHREGTPWTIVYNRDGNRAVIPNDLIAQHYNQIAAERRKGEKS